MTAGPRRRVAFVVDTHELGGAERYVAQLAEHLSERWTPDLIATRPVLGALRAPIAARGGRVLEVPPVRNKADLRGAAQVGRALRAARPDVVHLNLNTVANNRHALGLSVLRRPTVATLHIVAPIGSRVQRRVLGLAFGRLGRAIAVSEEIERQLRDELGLAPQRTTVIANGVEEAPALELRAEARPLRVGGLGRLTRQKGFDVLVEAVRLLAAEAVAVEAVVAGEGPERAALERAAAGLPVSLPGWAPDPGAFLAGLDVFCLPSRWEGLPFALLEAMMRGLPCVATPVGDIAAAATGACRLVAPDDPAALAAALRELAASPGARRTLGAAARERALANHSVAHMVAGTERVYEEVLGAWT